VADRPELPALLPSDTRHRQRYRILRSLGFGWRDCKLALRLDAFRRLVTQAGVDPDSYGDVARHHGYGGRPRVERPSAGAVSELRKSRYHELRALGASSREASEGMGSDMGYRRVKRQYCGVFKKDSQDP
jgi:hypothetical protein